ncbi:hypothetical protein FACS1894116_11020 [Betaproteobacteria bacterium]|nr:hypothetical protein FACS1894116_11020 [Betaproteobacteria bacterium]GHT99288.1 hypothetical protein FACS1894154_06120 [Betaproteobacteria bacterium]GHU25250.1 hypothetical protein FACS189488_11810 [Betaproteobacteria bacterium]GHU32012.1 hypothetical protein FACS189497_13310 [Betaproteobacteria bacterium]
MADSTLNTAVVITTQTEGDAKLAALVGELRSLAATAGEAAPAFTALADELESLNRQNALVAKFAELKRQLTDTDAALTAATDAVDALSGAMDSADYISPRLLRVPSFLKLLLAVPR